MEEGAGGVRGGGKGGGGSGDRGIHEIAMLCLCCYYIVKAGNTGMAKYSWPPQ